MLFITIYIYILLVLKRRRAIIYYDVYHRVPQSFSLYDSCHRHVRARYSNGPRVYTFVMIILHFKRLREKILTESDDVQLRTVNPEKALQYDACDVYKAFSLVYGERSAHNTTNDNNMCYLAFVLYRPKRLSSKNIHRSNHHQYGILRTLANVKCIVLYIMYTYILRR